MRSLSLPLTLPFVATILALVACGAKGDPRPNQRRQPAICDVRAIDLRTIEVVLPTLDTQGNRLSGIEAIRIYYLSLSNSYPSPLEVFQHGEAILEQRRPNIPRPGKTIVLNLSNFGRPPGWLVVVAWAGNAPGVPSQVLPWIDPSF
ncbi:MAG: hypothetical protein FWG12_02820 [Holophagaceae bacterium]|nr:hypothetical protein [Holophagaceae bacterium]